MVLYLLITVNSLTTVNILTTVNELRRWRYPGFINNSFTKSVQRNTPILGYNGITRYSMSLFFRLRFSLYETRLILKEVIVFFVIVSIMDFFKSSVAAAFCPATQ